MLKRGREKRYLNIPKVCRWPTPKGCPTEVPTPIAKEKETPSSWKRTGGTLIGILPGPTVQCGRLILVCCPGSLRLDGVGRDLEKGEGNDFTMSLHLSRGGSDCGDPAQSFDRCLFFNLSILLPKDLNESCDLNTC